MSIINASDLTKYYGAEFIFGNVSFQIARGDKVALVGVNGAGKSTLLKMLAGVEQPTQGSLALARGTRVAYLAQEANFADRRTLWQEMELSLAHLIRLQEEITALEHVLADTDAPEWAQRMEHYGELTHRFEHGGGYAIEHRIDRILHGLGFQESQYQQPIVQFSGGQKTRAALASALLSDPDLLLLDEPTNHLDLAALEWLERFLRDWDGTLVVISHDRYFLDKVTTRTMEMAFGKLEDYAAPYHTYLELKAERLELQLKHYHAQQEYIAKTEEFVRRFKSGQRSKEARGREKILNRLKHGYQGANGQWINERVDAPTQQKKLALSIETQLRSGELVLKFNALVVGYVGQQPVEGSQDSNPLAPRVQLIRCPDREILRGQRIALMGPNGSGKTTLLRTIVGDLPPLSGSVRLGHKVAITYYAQAHEGLRSDATVLDEIRRADPQIKETQARTLLGRFLFSGDDVFKRIADLSGGERSRVALAQLTLLGGNLLVLDEPTNHLDISAREALEVVLNEYNGSILFVSHDRYFIDAVADSIWMVQDGTIEEFHGTYSEYMTMLERRATTTERASSNDRSMETMQKRSASAHDKQRTMASQVPQTTVPSNRAHQDKEERQRQRKLASLEQEIALLEAELKQIESDMNAAGARGDVARVTALGMQYTEVNEMVASRMDMWARLAS